MPSFIEYDHRCDKMPDEMHGICKLKGSSTSQATVEKSVPHFARFYMTFYGFEFCPYCGERLGDAS